MSFQRQQIAALECRVAKLEAALAQPPPPLTTPMKVLRILDMVAEAHGLTRDHLIGKSRLGRVVRARHLAIYLAYATTSAGVRDIAQIFERDQSGASYAIRHVRDLAESDPATRREVDAWLKNLLNLN